MNLIRVHFKLFQNFSTLFQNYCAFKHIFITKEPVVIVLLFHYHYLKFKVFVVNFNNNLFRAVVI